MSERLSQLIIRLFGETECRGPARKIGVSPTTIQSWRRGEGIGLKGIVALSRYLNRSEAEVNDYLAGDIELDTLMEGGNDIPPSRMLGVILELLPKLTLADFLEVGRQWFELLSERLKRSDD